MHDAPNTLGIARRVRRRSLLAAAVRRGGLGLACGCGAGLVAVVADKLGWMPEPVRWEFALGSCAAAGLVVGVAAGLIGRWTLHAAARRADRVLGLRDRLSNALSFARSNPGPAEQVAIRDAERIAGSVAVPRVVPVRFGSAWAVWPVVLAGAVAYGVWVPQRVAGVRQVAQHQASEPERRAAADVIAQAAGQAREAAAETLADRAGDHELARMEEIERELLDGSREPEEALAEGARQLDALADRVEREAETEALADQQVREQLAEQANPGEGSSELTEALAKGDLQRAREAASALMDRFESMSPAEREQYARELERLAERMRDARTERERAPATGDEPARDGLDQALREQGIDEPESLGGSGDPAEVREQLEARGVEPEAAEPLAERVAERNREDQARERAREELDKLSEAAREAAEQLRKPTPPAQEPPTTQEQPTADDQQTDEVEPGDAPDRPDQPGAQPQGGEQREAEQQPDQQQPSQQPGEQQGGADQQGEQDSQSPGDSQQPTGQTQERPGTQPSDEPPSQPGDQPGGKPDGAAPPDQPGETPTGEAPTGETPTGETPTGETPADGEQPTGEPADTKPGTEPDTKPGDGSMTDPATPGQQPSPDDQQPAPDGQQPGEDGPAPATVEGGGEGGAEDGPTRMTDGSGDAADPSAMERFRRQLERMADRRPDAENQQRNAERLREQAERMLEQASPEERRELERLAREAMGEGDDPGLAGAGDRPEAIGAQAAPSREWDAEPFDARGEPSESKPSDGQVIAEWFGGDEARPSTGEATRGSGPALQEAARGAERAIERRAVPRERKDLVRRVFERFRQRAAEAGGDKDAAGAGDGA